MTAAQTKRDQRDSALAALRDMYPAGSTVQTTLLHVSQSGMLRSFAVLVAEPGGSIRDVSGLVARAIGAKLHQKTGGVSMGGCGMDMGYALTYSLSRALFADGFHCTGDDYNGANPCPSNDHVNERSRAPYATEYDRDRLHSDPGYALSHRHI